MLTQEQIIANKVRYIELLTKLDIDLTKLTKYLELDRVSYFTKPYTAYAENAYAGSLCEHALLVYDALTKLCEFYCPGKYTETDIIKVALFKDLYKAELLESYNKNIKDDKTGQWNTIVAYKTKDDDKRPIFGDASFSSYMIARKFIELESDELVEAICYSGIGNAYTPDIHNIRNDYKLVTLTTMAELAVNYLGD